jgi:hypothetical protein
LGRRRRAERGAAVIHQALQIDDCFELVQQLGFSGTRSASDYQQLRRGAELVDSAQTRPPQRLVTAVDARNVDAVFTQPLVSDLRAQSAAPAIQQCAGMRCYEGTPRIDARVARCTGNQFVTQRDGGLLAALLVARTDGRAFGVGEQREVYGTRECAQCEFRGCA